jgi:hypothetical protein
MLLRNAAEVLGEVPGERDGLSEAPRDLAAGRDPGQVVRDKHALNVRISSGARLFPGLAGSGVSVVRVRSVLAAEVALEQIRWGIGERVQ